MTLRKVAYGNTSALPDMKDQWAEARMFGRRALIALTLVLAAILTLTGRLVYLQIINHDHFKTLSESNHVKLQPVAPTRGLIFDRNGIMLADNLPSHRLEVTPERSDDLDATLAQLQELIEISQEDISRFFKLRRQVAPYTGIPLRFRLDDTELARVALRLHELPGVEIKADLNRHYPLGLLTAHIVGYVGRIDEQELQRIDTSQYRGSTHIGKTGVEKSYEPLLRGQVGHQHVEVNAEGRVLRVLDRVPPVPGRDVYLTIDIHLQQVAEQALQDHNGAVVAIDPRNGEILALVSVPAFDPNPFVNGIDAASYRALNTSRDRPLYNRALRGVYPPGSTIKPLMGLAALEYGIKHSGNTVYCPGFFRLPGSRHRFRDWKRRGHGPVDLDNAISQSCDVYFYDLATHLGIERIHDFLGQFSLGRPTGIDLPGEKSGLLPSKAWKRAVHNQPWYKGETVIVGIGQGYMLATPLQLAYSTAVLANRGRRIEPHVLYATRDPENTRIELYTPSPQPPIEVLHPGNWNDVMNAMINVVHGARGTARRVGNGSPYRIAGKTGTAQVFSLGQNQRYNAKKIAKHLHDHALFVAFAPAEDPRIAVAVIAEHGGGGSSTAAPIAKQVLDAHLLDLL